ncbi:MAG TPA: hypothetical protein VEJ86_06240 [Candidatus Binataceae bacterium]|nr:hypothetical protein [Candidatus Binataceae bacterium]
MRTRRLRLAVLAVTLGVAFTFATSTVYAAAAKVDCDAVMKELDSGKKVKDAAADLKVSVSSVYRCRRKAKQEAKSKSAPSAVASTAAASAGQEPESAASPASK